jgi:mannosyltransferase OCH1-like enzyme
MMFEGDHPTFTDPVSCAEDDFLRSSYARNLIQAPRSLRSPPSPCPSLIPKVIVQYWDDLSRMPGDVQECLTAWSQLENLGFERLMFDDRKARLFVSSEFASAYVKAFDLCYHPAMRCDYFRLCYILISGGFYVDADEMYQGAKIDHLFSDNRLKIQPLCYDTQTAAMISPEVFIEARQYSRQWIFYFNNNPIISPPGHPVIRLALERATRILINSSERPDIQSTTGPGNLTASLVTHSISRELVGEPRDFLILPDWHYTSVSRWPLSYRDDTRNWRLANSNEPE